MSEINFYLLIQSNKSFLNEYSILIYLLSNIIGNASLRLLEQLKFFSLVPTMVFPFLKTLKVTGHVLVVCVLIDFVVFVVFNNLKYFGGTSEVLLRLESANITS